MTPSPHSDKQYRFAIVSAVYNVDRYLGEFFASLDAQTIAHDKFQVIIVDDGSTDESAAHAISWAAETDIDVAVIKQDNGGQSSARNAGLEHVLADWVTFTDPDDILDANYFRVIDEFIDAHPETELVSTYMHDYFDDGREVSVDKHPLRFRYKGGDRVVDLDRFPRHIQLSAASAVVKYSRIQQLELRFDTRIRPSFEDAHFIQHYLLGSSQRMVAFLQSAVYHYRRRADGTSTVQTSGLDPRRYSDVPKFAYLDLLRHASAQGNVPVWLQYVIIYDLSWTFRAEEAIHGATTGVDSSTAESFHEHLRQIRPLLDSHVIEAYDLYGLSAPSREALLYGVDGQDWHWSAVVANRYDTQRELIELRYHYTGAQPSERILFRGLAITPHASKTRTYSYLRRTMVNERIIWISARGTIQVELNAQPVPVTMTWPTPPKYALRTSEITFKRGYKPAPIPKLLTKKKRRPAAAVRHRLQIERLASSRLVRRAFRDAWILMDRDWNSNDNAEHLFKYLRKQRRDINAWFTVKKDSPDYARLRKQGYRRILPHGSLMWKLACLNANVIASSHGEKYVFEPFARSGKWNWRFAFLQHGITKDDLSRWLNPKPITTFVTATVDEHASIAGSGNNYVFSTREVSLTGFPRHDRLIEMARKSHAESRKTILIMPTWRQYLAGALKPGSAEREHNDEFGDSEFCQRWNEVLNSAELHAAARDKGFDVTFMPHPNLEAYLSDFSVPADVRVVSYADVNVQEMIVSAALMITDYSSVAFDAALSDVPVVYYQFDRNTVFGGAHTTRPGYFDYSTHGFGPVAETPAELSDSLAATLSTAPHQTDTYAQRVRETFPRRDTKASKRVTDAIELSLKTLSPRRAHADDPTLMSPPIVYPN